MSILEDEKKFLFMTDLEPDDKVAIYLFSKQFKNSKIAFLVGEGDSQIKEIRMKIYIKKFGFTNAKVIRGYSSEKKFTYDGLDVMTKEQLDNLMKIDDDKNQTKKEIAEFIKNEEPFIISLKPPRELIEMWNDGFDMSKYPFAGYMSFNLRCLMRQWKPKLVSFLKSFQKCYFYETKYAVGGSKYSAITEKDFDFGILPKIVNDLIYYWNKYQVDLCNENIKNLVDLCNENFKNNVKTDQKSLQRLHRNKATLKQVLDNDYKQFVNADSGLIISLLQENAPYESRKVSYDLTSNDSYPKLEEGTDIKVIQPEDVVQYREFQVKMMKKIFCKNTA